MRLFIFPDWLLNLFPAQAPSDVASSFILAFCAREIEKLRSLTTKSGMDKLKNNEIQIGDLVGSGSPVFSRENENTAQVFYECTDEKEKNVRIKVSLEKVEKGSFAGKKEKWLVNSIDYFNRSLDNTKYKLDDGKEFVHHIYKP